MSSLNVSKLFSSDPNVATHCFSEVRETIRLLELMELLDIPNSNGANDSWNLVN